MSRQGGARGNGIKTLSTLALEVVAKHPPADGGELPVLPGPVAERVIAAWVKTRKVGKEAAYGSAARDLLASSGPGMEVLCLENGALEDPEFTAHALSSVLPPPSMGGSLCVVSITHATLPSPEVLHVLGERPAPQVHTLKLEFCGRSLDGDALDAFLGLFPGTRILSLRGAGTALSSADVARGVAEILPHQQLVSVNLSWMTRLEDGAVEALIGAHGESMRHVDLSASSRLTDVSLAAMAEGAQDLDSFVLTGLPRLSLAGLRILQAAFPHIDHPLGHPAGRRITHWTNSGHHNA